MVTVVQGKVCAKNHPHRLSRLATDRRTDGRTDRQTDFLWHRPDLTVGQKVTNLNENCRQNSYWNADSNSMKIFCILCKYSLLAAIYMDVSKSVVTAMRFTNDDKHLIKWMWVKKNYVEKRLLKMLPIRCHPFSPTNHLIIENHRSLI